MTINEFIFKVKRKLKSILGNYFFQYPRILKYKFLSNCQNVIGKPNLLSTNSAIRGGYNYIW